MERQHSNENSNSRITYAPFTEIAGRNRGVMVSMETGTSTAYALNNIQARGKLFVGPREKFTQE